MIFTVDVFDAILLVAGCFFLACCLVVLIGEAVVKRIHKMQQKRIDEAFKEDEE